MKIDFAQEMIDPKGEPIREYSLERIIILKAFNLDTTVRTLGDAMAVLEKAGVTLRDILTGSAPARQLKDVCYDAIEGGVIDPATGREEKIEPKEKRRRHHLATKIWGAKEPITISVADITLIIELVTKTFPGNLISGIIQDILDPIETGA